MSSGSVVTSATKRVRSPGRASRLNATAGAGGCGSTRRMRARSRCGVDKGSASVSSPRLIDRTEAAHRRHRDGFRLFPVIRVELHDCAGGERLAIGDADRLGSRRRGRRQEPFIGGDGHEVLAGHLRRANVTR